MKHSDPVSEQFDSYERPAVTVDVVLLSALGDHLWTLLVNRPTGPFRGRWALPGGFVRMEESLDEAAARVLSEKAGLEDLFVEQLYTFGELDRDPRARVITVAYVALVDWQRFESVSTEKSARTVGRIAVPWVGETGGPVDVCDAGGELVQMAFDHEEILGMAVKRLRGKLDYTPIGYQLLPGQFTLRQLQEVHETVMGRPFNKDSFRRRMLASGDLEATGVRQQDVGHRPAELYRFRRRGAV